MGEFYNLYFEIRPNIAIKQLLVRQGRKGFICRMCSRIQSILGADNKLGSCMDVLSQFQDNEKNLSYNYSLLVLTSMSSAITANNIC